MTQQKIDPLRQWMKKEKLDAFLVPHADMFQGEFVAPCDERLEWLTGFTGSAGLAIICDKTAGLFVDGRYTLQAPKQVDTDIFEICQVPQVKPAHWIRQVLTAGGIVAFDAWLHPLAHIRAYKKAFDFSGIIMKALDHNPLDDLWAERPPREQTPIWVHDLAYAGQSSEEKLKAIKDELITKNGDAVLITDPESVSWLFNIRGSDVPHTPLVHAFAWITTQGDDTLFLDPVKITDDVRERLGDLKIDDLGDIETRIKSISELGSTVQIDAKNCPYALYTVLTSSGVSLREADDPCALLKACKNEVEIEGARQAHIQDGVALVKFLHWLDQKAPKGELDELTVIDKLHIFRSEREEFITDSFGTIAGFGPNGAFIHYEATKETNLQIKNGSLLSVDSGGQYHSGTTDITRTVAIGTPTNEMKDRFTRVLKGMIAVTQVRFPVGTTGTSLDPLARHSLWAAGLDYAHGTGHGVGSFLGVHEGPQGISSRSQTPFKPGMILSNEPGYYKEGEYGIRIENLIVVVEDKKEGDELPMLCFETLTLAPIDKRLIDKDLLSDKEKLWLSEYHKRVVDALSDHLSAEEKAWLADCF